MEAGFNNGAFKLDTSNNVYYSGQTITGNVTFRLDSPQTISAINIQFLGEAKVLWSEVEVEKRNGTTFKTRVDYKAQEQYFNYVECLMGGQGVVELKARHHSVPFKFQIPPNAPSTFAGEKGQVTYEMRAFLEYPDVLKQRGELVKLFEVVAPLDLSKEGDARIKEPLKLSFEELYSCGCACRPAPLAVEVELPARGYCPGQRVPAAVRARNDTKVEVKGVTLQLLSKTRYRSQQPVAEVSSPEEVLATVKTGPVLAGVQRNYDTALLVPDLIAPNLAGCGIIDVLYFVKATVKVSGCHNDLVETCPVYIGLKPVSTFGKGEYVHPMAHSLPAGPIPDYPFTAISKTASNNSAINEIGFKEPAEEFKQFPTQINEGFKPPQPSQYPDNQPSQYPGNQSSQYPGNQSSQYPGNQPSQYPGNQPPQYPGYNYNQPGFRQQPEYPNLGNYLNATNNVPTYIPQQYPLNANMVQQGYSPSAPPM